MNTVTFQNVPSDVRDGFLTEIPKNKCSYCRKQEKKIQQEWVGHLNPQKPNEFIDLFHRKCILPALASQPRCPACAANAKIDFTYGERLQFFREHFANRILEYTIPLTTIVTLFSSIVLSTQVGKHFGPMMVHQFPQIFDYLMEPRAYIAVNIIFVTILTSHYMFMPLSEEHRKNFYVFQGATALITWLLLAFRGFDRDSPEMFSGLLLAPTTYNIAFHLFDYLSKISIPRTVNFFARVIRGRA